MTNPFQSHPEYQTLVRMAKRMHSQLTGMITADQVNEYQSLCWALEELPRLERALAEREAEDAR